MTADPDIRWQQRFQNFDRALSRLGEALTSGLEHLSELEQEGVVQRFEYSYELGWKTLKDFLEFSGVPLDPITPKNVIKQGFAAKIIPDGQVWIDMLNHRNVLSHRYDETEFRIGLSSIHTRYLPAMQALHIRLTSEFNA